MDQRLHLPAPKVENHRVVGKQFVISLETLETEVNYLTLSITQTSSVWFAQHTSEGMFDRLAQLLYLCRLSNQILEARAFCVCDQE